MSYGVMFVGFPQNVCVTLAGLTGLSGAANTFSTGATVTYSINGIAYTRATISGGTTPTTDFGTGLAFRPLNANQGSVFVWCFDAGGNTRVLQGSIETLDSSGNFVNAPQFPPIPDTVCPFGYCVIRATSTLASPFQFGVGNWNQTGLATIQVRNVLVMPLRPQIS